ncbi:MAG: exonuclease SbcCD subunit D [Anaerolineae bacterium]|nr:MAG: exonuclease SbcCD subunit D [Anaerolineae bacterium]
MERIRLLHFSDLHIGMENYGRLDPKTGVSERVLDFLQRFDELIDYGLEHDVDLVVFAGDAFKTRDPNPTYQRAFARRVKRLADAGVPVVLLVGNHDLPAMVQKASSVDIFHTLAVANVVVGRVEEVHRIETRRGPVQVVTVPYPVRSRLLSHPEYRGLSMTDLDQALRQVVTDLIEALKTELDPHIPAVLTGHFSVAGAVWSSERGVMLGRDVVVPKSALADPAFDYVALGHIHKHQNLTEGEPGLPPVVYAGSLERIDFGEEGQPKGFCWIELARGATTWEFVQVNARPFVTVRADVRSDDDPTQTVLDTIARHDISDAVVRLILDTTPETEARLREKEIEKALEPAHYLAAFVKETERPERIRLGGAAPESLTPIELLERYLESRNTPPERAQVLLQYAEGIFHHP